MGLPIESENIQQPPYIAGAVCSLYANVDYAIFKRVFSFYHWASSLKGLTMALG